MKLIKISFIDKNIGHLGLLSQISFNLDKQLFPYNFKLC
jgi:hypothetical protein